MVAQTLEQQYEAQFLNLVTFFDQYYRLNGEILSAEKAEDEFNIPKALTTYALAQKKFREALEERGIIFQRLGTDWTSKSLTPEQLIVANTLLDLTDTRSEKKKLQDLGVRTGTYNAWLKDPVFKDYISKRAEEMLGEHQSAIHLALIDRAKSGDTKAIAYFNEVTGRYIAPRAGSSSSVDVQSLIVQILEVIDLRVTDAPTKLAISQDLRALIAKRNMAHALTEQPTAMALPQAAPTEQLL